MTDKLDESQPPPQPPHQESEERIAALEAEVQQLRARLGGDGQATPEPGATTGGEPPRVPEPVDLGEVEAEVERLMPSRVRAVVIPVLIGVLVLAAILGLTSVLSRGFDSFARQAARSMVPDDPEEDDDDGELHGLPGAADKREDPAAGKKAAPPAEKAEEPALRAPGL